jgi:hypothetical protein
LALSVITVFGTLKVSTNTMVSNYRFNRYDCRCRTPNLPFGRLIAMTRVSDTNFRIWDAGYARYIYGPGYLWFRMNERDGECLKNNYGYLRVDIYFR